MSTTELLSDHILKRLEALETRVRELESRTVGNVLLGGFVDFGTVDILEKQIAAMRESERPNPPGTP